MALGGLARRSRGRVSRQYRFRRHRPHHASGRAGAGSLARLAAIRLEGSVGCRPSVLHHRRCGCGRVALPARAVGEVRPRIRGYRERAMPPNSTALHLELMKKVVVVCENGADHRSRHRFDRANSSATRPSARPAPQRWRRSIRTIRFLPSPSSSVSSARRC